MEYTRVRNTIMSNKNGVLSYCMSFSLQNLIVSNSPVYLYGYDVYDLVEIEFNDDLLIVYDFPFTGDRASYIRDNLEFLVSYFESAGLKGKRFLYNLQHKMPVNYVDFAKLNKLPYPTSEDFAFILDMKEGYVSGVKAVNLFTTSDRTIFLDKCVLSFFNKASEVMKPRDGLSLEGSYFTIMLAGLLSGIPSKGIEIQLNDSDTQSKFFNTISGFKINSEYINKVSRGLKVDKFMDILTKPQNKKEEKEGVYLRDIIDVGLDKFVKTIKDETEPLTVELDCEWQTIRSMFILKGIAFITPSTMKTANYFKDLLNSDNVELVLN